MELTVLNNILTWDGSHLGSYDGIHIQQWYTEGIKYFGIILAHGVIYCNMTRTKSLFPCIVEEIKDIFGLTRRGIHRITINKREYVIYYVPITEDNQLIWETPLNKLDSKHPLRVDHVFREKVQKVAVFCDILSLSRLYERSIQIRPSVDGYIPISTNETSTTIIKELQYDYSVLTKQMFLKWFGENTSISSIVKKMLRYDGSEEALVRISSNIRNKVDVIIKKYDDNYTWYTNFITDRTSRYLLEES